MIDQIKLLCKTLTGEINTLKGLWRLIRTAIGYISSFFSFGVLLRNLVAYDKLELWTKGHWQLILIAGLIISCIHNRKKLGCCKMVSGRDMQIAISVKDIFSNRSANSYVIPTNTFFRTKMQDEYISPRSVQGRFQLKYFKKNMAALDEKISESLAAQEIIGEDADDCFGPTKRYPIGTVAKIDLKGKHFYFVAVNDVNQYGKPIGQTIENVTTALTSIGDAIQSMGYCDVLCIPLIGSGRAAIQAATKEVVMRKTIDSFVQTREKIVDKLIISINPTDYLEGKVDLERIKKYLDYRCEFYRDDIQSCNDQMNVANAIF